MRRIAPNSQQFAGFVSVCTTLARMKEEPEAKIKLLLLEMSGTTWLLAADFDEANWQADVAGFRKCCTVLGLTPAVERSCSGNGAHVWIFFSEPVSAADARRLGSGLLTRTMACRHELSFASYDRLFPTQDTVPKGGFGNLIALPFQGQAQKAGNTLFVDEQFVPYPDQWAFLSTLPKVTPEQLTGLLTTLCQDGDVGALAETAEKPVPWQRKRAQRDGDRGVSDRAAKGQHSGFGTLQCTVGAVAGIFGAIPHYP